MRDRGATERAILAAAKSLLAEEGFQNFGINAGRPPRRLRQAADLPLLWRPRRVGRGNRRRSRYMGEGS
ncbi:TetR family transcriptional regulator, partial [Rhizobium sp. Pop5]